MKRLRIVESLRNGVALGRLLPGSKLPDRTWYMEKFGVTRGTVQEAFDQLAAEGFTVAVRHKGTSVTKVPPFRGRYLLALCGTEGRPVPYPFDRALQAAARQLEKSRGVVFDVRTILDEGPESEVFAEVLADLRNQRYSGAFLRALAINRGLSTIGNVDNVPITGFFSRVDRSQGSHVFPLMGSDEGRVNEVQHLTLLLSECRRAGKRSVLVVANSFGDEELEDWVRKQAAFHGLHCGPNGYLLSGLEPAYLRQLTRFLKLLLAPGSRNLPEAIVLEDDNFLEPLETALRELYGEAAPQQFFVVSNANQPLIPSTGLDVTFHGVDTLATLSSFMDWAEAVHLGKGTEHPPKVVLF